MNIPCCLCYMLEDIVSSSCPYFRISPVARLEQLGDRTKRLNKTPHPTPRTYITQNKLAYRTAEGV